MVQNYYDFNQLSERAKAFHRKHGIDKSKPRDQYLKVAEETGELGAALARNDIEAAMDAIGDIYITIEAEALTLGVTLDECVASVLNIIEAREGNIENGIFIKKEDKTGGNE